MICFKWDHASQWLNFSSHILLGSIVVSFTLLSGDNGELSTADAAVALQNLVESGSLSITSPDGSSLTVDTSSFSVQEVTSTSSSSKWCIWQWEYIDDSLIIIFQLFNAVFYHVRYAYKNTRNWFNMTCKLIIVMHVFHFRWQQCHHHRSISYHHNSYCYSCCHFDNSPYEETTKDQRCWRVWGFRIQQLQRTNSEWVSI